MQTLGRFFLLMVLFGMASGAHAATTHGGVSANPIDGGTNNEGAPGTPAAIAITPPASRAPAPWC